MSRSSTVGYKPLLQRLLSAFCTNDMQDAKQQAYQGQGQDTVAEVEIIGMDFSHSLVIVEKNMHIMNQTFHCSD